MWCDDPNDNIIFLNLKSIFITIDVRIYFVENYEHMYKNTDVCVICIIENTGILFISW